MRRRLVLLSLATTLLVVVSFVVPLGFLVRRQAVNNARAAAETDAQTVAGLVALALALGDSGSVAEAVGPLPEGTVVIFGDVTVAGTPVSGQGTLASASANSGSTVARSVPGGWEIALPVVGAEGVVVVDSFVTSAELTSGVAGAWVLLGLLAVVLIGAAMWVADRLGRDLVRPIEQLAGTARALAEGNLEARVDPADPSEIRDVGEAVNFLADRLDQLIAEERENVADLSHQLRTPLTALRLQAESLRDFDERESVLTQIDRLEHAVSQLIALARTTSTPMPGECDLDEVLSERLVFWSVLAEEQGREIQTAPGGVGTVVVPAGDVGTIVDNLIENVFAHTPAGTGFRVASGKEKGVAWVELSDDGPGFRGPAPVSRGVSGAGSTGLGLDIVRKIARRVGGSVDADDRPGGGAVVRVYLGDDSV